MKEANYLAMTDEARQTQKVRRTIDGLRRGVIHVRLAAYNSTPCEKPDQPDQPDHKATPSTVVGFWRRFWSGFGT